MYAILAIDSKNGISSRGKIPWSIPEDISNFEALTQTAPPGKQNALIMGAQTWNSTPFYDKTLNIVLTTGKTKLVEKLNAPYVASSLDNGLEIAKTLNVFRIFIIGGVRLFHEAKVKGYFITRLNDDFQCDKFLYQKLYPDDDKISYSFKSGKSLEVSFCYRGSLKIYEKPESSYLDLLNKVIQIGEVRQTRNGMVRSLFSAELEFSLEFFPLLTTKKMFFKGIIEELLFFLRGETDTTKLSKEKVHIWEKNTSRKTLDKLGFSDYPQGEMGPMYGYQWRSFNKPFPNSDSTGIDTFSELLDNLCSDPTSRRLILTTLNMSQVRQGVLWPCHGLVVQFYVSNDRKLSCKMYQRSADIFLGMPFNISSYSALVYVICKVLTNRGHPMTPGKLYLSFGDVHIYEEHISAATQQLIRPPFDFPKLTLENLSTNVEDFTFKDFKLENYVCYPKIPAKIL